MSRIVSKSDLVPGLIEDLDIFRIRPSRMPLRSQLTNIEQLAQSIKEKGLLQPIIVRADDTDSFEIVAGNRRFNACKSLHWRKIPSHIVELDDKDVFEISLIENIQRKRLNPIEEAEAFKKYVSDFGWGGISDLAKRIGKSPAYVTKRIKLLDLPKHIVQAIQRSIISASAAEELFPLTHGSEQSKLSELISRRHLSFREARSLSKYASQESDTRMLQPSGAEVNLEKVQRAIDRIIIILKTSMSKLAPNIDNVEDNWIIHEILMQHKNILHMQIELLLREKKKLVTKPVRSF